MTNSLFAMQGSAPLIDINGLAYKTGMSPEQTRSAGQALFLQLSGDDLNLTQALVDASSASGANPRQILDMVRVLADEFAKPAPDNVAGLGDRLGQIGSAASDKLGQLTDSARETLSEIDFEGARDKAIDAGHLALDKVGDALKRARDKITKD